MRLLLALTAVALLAGCLSPDPPAGTSDEEPETQGEPVNQPRTVPGQEPEQAGEEPPAEGEGVERMFSCRVETGAPSGPVAISFALNDMYVGSCPITTTNGVSVVVARSAGAGCTINAGLEEVLTKGKQITATCEDAGPAESSITLRTWS